MNVLERKKLKFCSFRVSEFQSFRVFLLVVEELTFLKKKTILGDFESLWWVPFSNIVLLIQNIHYINKRDSTLE